MKQNYLVVGLLMICGGCADYTRSKIDLASRAQAGLTSVRAEVDAQRARSAAASDALRARLDAAFDEDVASRGEPLEAEWVIAHRKAYALAIDAFETDRRAADADEQATLRTLDAISAALTQLQQMHAAELKLTLPEITLPAIRVAEVKP